MESPLGRPATWLRDHPFVADAALAGAAFLVTVLLPSGSYWPDEGLSFVVGTVLVVPLAWRRRAPVAAASVVVLAGLVVATVAGLLASVLPARRAARTAPVAAIAG